LTTPTKSEAKKDERAPKTSTTLKKKKSAVIPKIERKVKAEAGDKSRDNRSTRRSFSS